MKKNGLTCISYLEDITEGDAESDLGITISSKQDGSCDYLMNGKRREAMKRKEKMYSNLLAFLHLLRLSLLLSTCRTRFRGL